MAQIKKWIWILGYFTAHVLHLLLTIIYIIFQKFSVNMYLKVYFFAFCRVWLKKTFLSKSSIKKTTYYLYNTFIFMNG